MSTKNILTGTVVAIGTDETLGGPRCLIQCTEAEIASLESNLYGRRVVVMEEEYFKSLPVMRNESMVALPIDKYNELRRVEGLYADEKSISEIREKALAKEQKRADIAEAMVAELRDTLECIASDDGDARRRAEDALSMVADRAGEIKEGSK